MKYKTYKISIITQPINNYYIIAKNKKLAKFEAIRVLNKTSLSKYCSILTIEENKG